MRPVVVLAHFFPFPPRVGAEIRTSTVVKALSSAAEVGLIAQKSGDPDLEEASRHCATVVPVEPPGNGFVTRAARRAMEPFDGFPAAGRWLNLEGFRKALYSLPGRYDDALLWLEASWLAAVLEENDGRKVVLDQHNLDSEVIKTRRSNALFPLSLLYGLDLYKQERLERGCLGRASLVFAVSEEDAAAHREKFPGLKVEVLPNVIELDRYRCSGPDSGSRTIIMTGDFGYAPNIEGLSHFLSAIFPLVRRKEKGANLLVAGRGSDRVAKNEPGTAFHGEFGRPEEVFGRASLSIAPILTGGGSRYKIIESLACGVPVVSTPRGAEGLSAGRDEGVFVEETSRGFADAVLELLSDGEKATAAGARGRKFVEERYSFEGFGRKLVSAVSPFLR